MDGVGLPMANPVTSLNGSRSMLDADASPYLATALAARAVALTIGPLATQIPSQVTTSGLVGIDELVDGLMTDG